jgi:hypothetical protein
MGRINGKTSCAVEATKFAMRAHAAYRPTLTLLFDVAKKP